MTLRRDAAAVTRVGLSALLVSLSFRGRTMAVLAAAMVVAGGAVASGGLETDPEGEIVFARSLREYGKPSLYVAAADGSQARLLVRNAADPAASPDGRRIAFVRGHAIWLLQRPGMAQKQLTRPKTRTTVKSPDVPEADLAPAWAPDGRTIYFSRWANKTYTGALFSIRSDGTGLRQLTHPTQTTHGHGHFSPAPSPDGRTIVFTDTWDLNHAIDNTLAAVTRLGRPLKLPFRLPAKRDGGGGDAPYLDNAVWSPDGRVLAFEAWDSYGTGVPTGIYVSSADGARPRRLLPVSTAASPAWSTDGKWISFSSGGDIWRVRSDGTESQQLTHTHAHDSDPAWLPPIR